MKTLKTLAERLTWARNRKKLSQQKLADLAGVSQSAIGNLESGIRFASLKMPTIASVLGVDALWLAEGKGAQPSETDTGAPSDTTHRETADQRLTAGPSAATERVLQALAGRSEDEILEIANALDSLLRLGHRKPVARRTRTRTAEEKSTSVAAQDDDAVMFSVGKPRTRKRQRSA